MTKHRGPFLLVTLRNRKDKRISYSIQFNSIQLRSMYLDLQRSANVYNKMASNLNCSYVVGETITMFFILATVGIWGGKCGPIVYFVTTMRCE